MVSRMTDPLMFVLLHPNIHQVPRSRSVDDTTYVYYEFAKEFNINQVVYAFEVITSMLEYSGEDIVQFMKNQETLPMCASLSKGTCFMSASFTEIFLRP
jgi:hypothetical protein